MYITNETIESLSNGFKIYYEDSYIRGAKSPDGEESEDVDYVGGNETEAEYMIKFNKYSIIVVAELDSDDNIVDTYLK